MTSKYFCFRNIIASLLIEQNKDALQDLSSEYAVIVFTTFDLDSSVRLDFWSVMLRFLRKAIHRGSNKLDTELEHPSCWVYSYG